MNQTSLLDQIDQIRTYDESNILLLSSLCVHTDPEIRFRAVEKIALLTEDRTPSSILIKLVADCLEDIDELVRCASLEFFEDHSSSISIEKCIGMLKDKEPIVRAQAARVIGNMKNDMAMLALTSALQVAEDFEKVPLNFAIFQLRPSTGLEPIFKLLDSPDHRARCAAANLLSLFKDSELSSFVIERLQLSLATDKARASQLAKLKALNELR